MNSLNSPENDLLSRLLSRDEKAVREFYDRYSPQLLAFIRRKIGDEHDVEEIAQDTLFAFLEAIRDFTGSAKLSTYLLAIAHNKIVDFYRKKRLKKVVFSQMPQGIELLFSKNKSPEDEYDQKLLEEKIKFVLASLTPQYARMIVLKYIDGRSVAEISQLLECSFKSAESLLFRARKAFVKYYEQR